jgi:hypothetical protein
MQRLAPGSRPAAGRGRIQARARRARMYIGYTAEQEALRRELRGYYERLLTPEV